MMKTLRSAERVRQKSPVPRLQTFLNFSQRVLRAFQSSFQLQPKYFIFRLSGWANLLYVPASSAQEVQLQFGEFLSHGRFSNETNDAVPFLMSNDAD